MGGVMKSFLKNLLGHENISSMVLWAAECFRKNMKNPPAITSHCAKNVQIRSFFGPYFPVFGLNMGKYGPDKTPYLDTFHAVPTFIM